MNASDLIDQVREAIAVRRALVGDWHQPVIWIETDDGYLQVESVHGSDGGVYIRTVPVSE